MTTFTREDGRELQIVEGFRSRALSYREGVTPGGGWNDDDYARAVEKKIKRSDRLINQISLRHGALKNTEVLEIGCGDGLNTILLGLRGAKRAVGIDLDLRLNRQDERGESVRRLSSEVLEALGVGKSLYESLDILPVKLLAMDASRMEFPDDGFDLAFSRSVLEHIQPIDKLFSEIRRVVRPQGMIYHEIDPFYWLRGCHKRGLVDIPWAHARLAPDEFHRFVLETEGERTADKRLSRLRTLNRLTLRDWKMIMEKSPFEIVDWTETRSAFAEEILNENPDIISTLLPGVEPEDLVVGRVRIWLRNSNK